MYARYGSRTTGATIHFSGGRDERLVSVRDYPYDYYYPPDYDSPRERAPRADAVGVVSAGVDQVRFLPPYFCAAFPEAEAVSIRLSSGEEAMVPCRR
jgi:hypothetical protein